MELTQALVLAIVQGLTEFLPISSSAHLIMVPFFAGWPDQGLSFDVALNTATWLSVVIYFRRDLIDLLSGFIRTLKEKSLTDNHHGALAWMLVAATIPVGIAGLLAHDIVAHDLRTVEVIGWSSIVWGIVLWVADRKQGSTEIKGSGWATVLIVGLAQAVALIPGTSRSGITMTAGLFMGLTRTAAARLSFLLAIVVGGLAGAKEGVDMVQAGLDTPWAAVAVGFIAAFVSAYFAIHYFLKIISRFSMTPFVVYRILLGILLISLA